MAVTPNWEERLRGAIEAYNRGEYEAVMDLTSDDVELQRAATSPESREVLRGRDRVLEFFRPDVFEQQEVRADDIEVGEDSLIVHTLFKARGRGSGLPVEIESWVVYRVEGETLTRIEIYNDPAEARAAAGLVS